MDSSGHINALGQQYIGATTPYVTPGFQPGVVHGGNGSTASPPASSAAVLNSRRASISCTVLFAMAALVMPIV